MRWRSRLAAQACFGRVGGTKSCDRRIVPPRGLHVSWRRDVGPRAGNTTRSVPVPGGAGRGTSYPQGGETPDDGEVARRCFLCAAVLHADHHRHHGRDPGWHASAPNSSSRRRPGSRLSANPPHHVIPAKVGIQAVTQYAPITSFQRKLEPILILALPSKAKAEAKLPIGCATRVTFLCLPKVRLDSVRSKSNQKKGQWAQPSPTTGIHKGAFAIRHPWLSAHRRTSCAAPFGAGDLLGCSTATATATAQQQQQQQPQQKAPSSRRRPGPRLSRCPARHIIQAP